MPATRRPRPLVAFVADDLTGASDVLAQVAAEGLDAVLVLRADGALPHADVVGIGTAARSLAGPALDAVLGPALARAAAAGPRVLLHKVCSTFDSSPTTGSIGRAVELLAELLPGHGPVPVAPAQPSFGRYTAFGNHFGRADVDGVAEVHRLDRHPVMAQHPSTPMHEADLRRVLAGQLVGGPDVPGLPLDAHGVDDGGASFAARWAALRAGASPAFVVDAVTDAHLDAVAELLLAGGPEDGPAVVVGSGGVAAALARRLAPRDAAAPAAAAPARGTGPALAVSASASRTTAAQVADAVAHGWTAVAVPAGALRDRAADPAAAPWATTALRALRDGRDVVVHTALGPDDARLQGPPLAPAAAGRLIGAVARRAVAEGLTRDVAICGGDTSSHALAALDVGELRVVEQLVVAGPVCAADDASALAGCRVLLKGGQVGPPDVLRRFARRPVPATGATARPTGGAA